jgi:hypothetical protein
VEKVTNDGCSKLRVASRVQHSSEHVYNEECMPDITSLPFHRSPPLHLEPVWHPTNYDHISLTLSLPYITSCSIWSASPHAS